LSTAVAGVRRQPAFEHGRSAHGTILFREIHVNDAADIAIELDPSATIAKAPDPRKAGSDNLVGVGF
jgi:hypothetical protein